MRVWLVLPVFLIGCGSGMSTYEIAPAQGRWDFSVLEKTTDECAASDVRADVPLRPEIADVWVTPVDGGGFTMAVNGGDEAACTVSGGNFECVASVERVRVSDELLLSTAVFVSGWIEGGNGMDGDFTFDYGCRGTECADFTASYGLVAPCRTEGTFLAQPEHLEF